jgi:hypothetical protein
VTALSQGAGTFVVSAAAASAGFSAQARPYNMRIRQAACIRIRLNPPLHPIKRYDSLTNTTTEGKILEAMGPSR